MTATLDSNNHSYIPAEKQATALYYHWFLNAHIDQKTYDQMRAILFQLTSTIINKLKIFHDFEIDYLHEIHE